MSNLFVNNLVTNNSTVSNLSSTNAILTNTTISNATMTNATMTGMSVTNAVSTNSTTTNMNVTSMNSTNSISTNTTTTNLNVTNIKSTNTTTTNLNATTGIFDSLTLTSVSSGSTSANCFSSSSGGGSLGTFGSSGINWTRIGSILFISGSAVYNNNASSGSFMRVSFTLPNSMTYTSTSVPGSFSFLIYTSGPFIQSGSKIERESSTVVNFNMWCNASWSGAEFRIQFSLMLNV